MSEETHGYEWKNHSVSVAGLASPALISAISHAEDAMSHSISRALYADTGPHKPPTRWERLKAWRDRMRNRLAYWIATDDAFDR